MSCLLLKGSSGNPAPPKEEVKGPEVGGCKRGHEREAKIIVKTEATDVHSANAHVPRASARPPTLRGSAARPHGDPGLSQDPCFPPPSTARVLWPVTGKPAKREQARAALCLDGLMSQEGCDLPHAPSYPHRDTESFLTPGSPGPPAHASEMGPAQALAVAAVPSVCRLWAEHRVRTAAEHPLAPRWPEGAAAPPTPAGTGSAASARLLSPPARPFHPHPPTSNATQSLPPSETDAQVGWGVEGTGRCTAVCSPSAHRWPLQRSSRYRGTSAVPPHCPIFPPHPCGRPIPLTIPRSLELLAPRCTQGLQLGQALPHPPRSPLVLRD